MKTMLIFAAAIAASIGIARADPVRVKTLPGGEQPRWTRLQSTNGDVFFVALNTIHRFPKGEPLAGSATIMVYREMGPPNGNNLYTLLFDCRGRFSLWGRPEDTRPTSPDTIIGVVEEAACGRL